MSLSDLKKLCIALVEDSITAKDLQHLIQLLMNIAAVIIRTTHWRFIASYRDINYTPHDLSVICIEDLVQTKKNIRCYELRQFLTGLGDLKFRSEEDIISELRRLIYSAVHRSLFDMCDEVDPVYRKIYRNVHEVISKSEKYHITVRFNEKCVHRLNEIDAAFHKPEYPVDELLVELHRIENSTTESIMNALFDFLEKQNEYRAALSTTTIIALQRQYFLMFHEDENDIVEPHFIDRIDISFVIQKTIDHVRNKQLERYVLNEIYTPDQINSIESALRSMLHDLCDSKPRKLFDYYHDQFPEVDYTEFQKNGKIRFEYITHTAKEQFITFCKQQLF